MSDKKKQKHFEVTFPVTVRAQFRADDIEAAVAKADEIERAIRDYEHPHAFWTDANGTTQSVYYRHTGNPGFREVNEYTPPPPPPPTFKPGEFDYRAAHYWLAAPAFGLLDEDMRALYRRVCDEAAELTQMAGTLEMPWPKDMKLRYSFEARPARALADAARAVYSYGHWSSTGQSYVGAGGTWKFSDYADQTLRARYADLFGTLMPPKGYNRSEPRVSVDIIEGALRICLNTPDTWTWEEIGPATEANCARAAELAAVLTGNYSVSKLARDRRDAWVDQSLQEIGILRDAILADDPLWAKWLGHLFIQPKPPGAA